MMKTDRDTLADIAFTLHWKSNEAVHTDRYFAQNVNFYRDCFPAALYDRLLGQAEGREISMDLNPGDVMPLFDPKKRFEIKHSQFDTAFRQDEGIEPRYGRFYPKGILKDVANVFRANAAPFRCLDVRDSGLQVDFNHPLSGKDLKLNAKIESVKNKGVEKGGVCKDWIEILTEGPGMQARSNGRPTDFFSVHAFSRVDETPDNAFYEKPRLVNHIDRTASKEISNIYGKLLKPDMAVLDLMSSWTSHLPPHLKLSRISGLGLNEQELQANRRLTEHVVHDLNTEPRIPLDDGIFDAVICTASVEYLTRPFRVFEDVHRVLKPGGLFIVTFSNRWFPPKVTNIWQTTHEFERIGIVSEYFMASGLFGELETFSIRGLPRPEDDKYFGQYPYSDPVYAVCGRRGG